MDPRACLLIVDDEERNRALLRAMLRDQQYRTLEAESGTAALEMLRRERVDLVLLDVMMPEMSGYEVCKVMKEQHQESFLPVLLITALSDQEQKNLGLQAGADDFLAKPVDRRELLLRVRSFLRLRGQDMLIRLQLKKLTELQTAKDEMLSLMVHDLRSPLSGIIAHLHLLIEDLAESGPRDDARAALRGADAMLKSIEVSTAVEGHSDACLDGKLVRRAIENLLGNALKYTPGGKDVSVVVRHLPGSVEVDVADRGPGIPADLKASMFEKFGSVEAKKGGPRKGFGLGLYLVKLVAEGHAGTAEVLDREGGGALFRVRLGTRAA